MGRVAVQRRRGMCQVEMEAATARAPSFLPPCTALIRCSGGKFTGIVVLSRGVQLPPLAHIAQPLDRDVRLST